MAEGNNNNNPANGNNAAPAVSGTPLSKLFNFRPKEYCASSHGVRSRKMIKRWAYELKHSRPAPAAPAGKKK